MTPDVQHRINNLCHRIDGLPRFPLAHLPTPLEHAPRFSRLLGGANVYLKRDDCTGLALGGNKTRHNEFVLGEAIRQGTDLIVWGAGVQSNNCRQTAAACAKAGIDCHLVLGRGRPADGPDAVQGNLLLDQLVGASYEIVEDYVGEGLDRRIAAFAESQQSRGRVVYFWDRETVRPLAAISYMLCLIEIVAQTDAEGFTPDAIYVCSAGSTGSGLALAAKVLGLRGPVVNVCPIMWEWDTQADMARIASQAAELIGLETRISPDEMEITLDYVSPGYGKVSTGCLEAIELLARTEGVLLDPVYSGKAMAGLIDHIRSGRIAADQNVVFVHTGGTPALFAYHKELSNGIPVQPPPDSSDYA